MALEINIIKWNDKDWENIPPHILLDVPIAMRRIAAIKYRISHSMRIHSTVIRGC